MEEYLARIAEAGSLLESGTGEEHVLKQIQDYLESLKQDASPQLLISLAVEILNGEGFSDAAKLIAMHLWRDGVIKTRWQTLDEHTASVAKTQLLKLLRKPGWRRNVAETLALAAADIAVRDWPQRWPTFIDELVEIGCSGDDQAKIACAAIRFLGDEVVNSQETIVASRKQKISAAIVVSLQIIFPFLCGLATQEYTKRQTEQHDADLLLAALSAIEALVNFSPLRVVFEFNVFDACVHLLADEELRGSALDCLDIIVSTRGSSARNCEKLLRDNYFPLLMKTIIDLHALESEYAEDHHEFQRRKLAQTIGTLFLNFLRPGTSFLEPAFGQHSGASGDDIRSGLVPFLEMMLRMAYHRSLAVVSEAVAFWHTYLRTTFSDRDLMSDMASAVISIIAYDLARIEGAKRAGGKNSNLLLSDDVDQPEEILAALVKARSSAIDCARAGVKVSQTVVLKRLCNLYSRAASAFLSPQPVSGFSFEPEGNQSLVLTADLWTALLGLTVLVDGVVTTLQDVDSAEREFLREAFWNMQAVAKSSGPVELVALAAYSLSAFACLKVLLSLSLYRAPEEKATPVDQLSEETCNLRMRSSVSLLTVCRRLGEGDLAILLPHLLPRITPLLNNSLDLRHEERLQLLEAAAHGSNHFSSMADQSLYLESLLHGTLNMLAEFRAAGVLEDLSKFNALSMDVHARERLSEVVHTCEVASHAVRTNALNRKVFPAVLEPMVLLMRTIHELNPPPTARELVVILNLETAPGSKDAMDRLQQMGVALGDEASIARQHFVGKLRDSTYEVIANACSKNLSDSLLVQEMVFSSVLESVAVLEPVSIYSFVRVVVRLVLHTCGSTFCASLVNTVTRIQARIADGIARLNSIESTSESIALDHAWRLVQRACVDAVREPALRAAGRLEEGLEDNFPEEFRALLLQSMSSFDSHASESSAQTVLKGMAVFQPAPVLQACMQALCKASLHSVHESVITVLLAAISSSPQQSASWLVSASNVSAQSVEELVSKISSSGKKSGRNALKTFIREKLGIAFGVPEGSAKVRAVLDLDHPLIIPGKSQGQFKDPAAARQRTEALHAQVPIDLAHAFDEPDKS